MNLQYYYDVIDAVISLYWKTLSRARGMILYIDDISYVMAKDRKGPERIFDVHLDPDTIQERLDEIMDLIKAQVIPNTFLLSPKSSPPDIASILVERGFEIDTSGLCMAMDLSELENIKRYGGPISVCEVDDVDTFQQWVHIAFTALIGSELMSIDQLCDIFCLPDTHFYLASMNGIPASTCMTISSGEIADLDWVATLEPYRRQGLATSVITKALIDLHDAGVKTVSLRAEPAGISFYKRIGFKAYCNRIVAQ
jgi:GNAT superfamily N-acetyltransferase